MAKSKEKTLTNITTGKLILWDGREILPGGTLEITPELAENAGVQSWIDDGLLGEATAAVVIADNAALQVENDALKAQVEALTADLAEATKPK